MNVLMLGVASKNLMLCVIILSFIMLVVYGALQGLGTWLSMLTFV